LNATPLERPYVFCGEGEPFSALPLFSEAAVPVLLDSFWIVRLDDMHSFGFLWQLDCEFTEMSSRSVRAAEFVVFARAKEVDKSLDAK